MAASGSRSEVSVLQALRAHVAQAEARERENRILAEAVQVVAGEAITETEIQEALLAACAEAHRMALDEALARELQARDVQEATDARLAHELSLIL